MLKNDLFVFNLGKTLFNLQKVVKQSKRWLRSKPRFPPGLERRSEVEAGKTSKSTKLWLHSRYEAFK